VAAVTIAAVTLLVLCALAAAAATLTIDGCDTLTGTAPNLKCSTSSTPPPDPAPGNFCNSATTTQMQHTWGTSTSYPKWPANNTLVIVVTIPANAIWGLFGVGFGEYNSPPTARRASMSAFPCDFRAPDPKGVNGPIDVEGGNSGNLGANLSSAGPLFPGKTYYLNFRNEFKDGSGQWVPSCSSTTCQMVLGFQNPK
jgi:hypothetical protein